MKINWLFLLNLFLILVSIIIIILIYFSGKKYMDVNKKNRYNIETPTIRPKYIYPGGPFSKNNEINVFPNNSNLILYNNAKLWGVPLAPPFPKYPWPPSL